MEGSFRENCFTENGLLEFYMSQRRVASGSHVLRPTYVFCSANS